MHWKHWKQQQQKSFCPDQIDKGAPLFCIKCTFHTWIFQKCIFLKYHLKGVFGPNLNLKNWEADSLVSWPDFPRGLHCFVYRRYRRYVPVKDMSLYFIILLVLLKFVVEVQREVIIYIKQSTPFSIFYSEIKCSKLPKADLIKSVRGKGVTVW